MKLNECYYGEALQRYTNKTEHSHYGVATLPIERMIFFAFLSFHIFQIDVMECLKNVEENRNSPESPHSFLF